MTRSNRHYIAVDEDDVLRCKWCGTTESSSWIREEGGPWCSYECRSADLYNRNLCGLIAFPLIVLAVWVSSMQAMEDIPSAVAMTFWMLPLLFGCPATCLVPGVISGRKARKAVPRHSRWKGRSISQEIHVCVQCGGALDISDGDTLVRCPYCGVLNEATVEDDDDTG
ncbi:hypothetical protein EU545_00125 [Candidatus Thorarchaeota archaeon]|nr:MAG: hypothetical protein EU545_00125 [Candidatus Thorarchaeota archaeon]